MKADETKRASAAVFDVELNSLRAVWIAAAKVAEAYIRYEALNDAAGTFDDSEEAFDDAEDALFGAIDYLKNTLLQQSKQRGKRARR